MQKNTSIAGRIKRYFDEMREKGFTRICVWAHPDDAKRIRAYAAELQRNRD